MSGNGVHRRLDVKTSSVFASNVGSIAQGKPLLILTLLLAVAGSGCQPIGADLESVATARSKCPCEKIADIIGGDIPNGWHQNVNGDALGPPEVEVFKLDSPPGEGRKIRTLCPDAKGCDAAFLYGETVDATVRHRGGGPAPDFILAKATYSAPGSGAVGVYLGDWDATGTHAPHEQWRCFPWLGEFHYSLRGFQGEGQATVTFEFWSLEVEESHGTEEQVRWRRSAPTTVNMQATPNEQCHCCSACTGTDSSRACGKKSRESAGLCQTLDALSVGNARIKIQAGSSDPLGIAKVSQLDNGDIQFQRGECHESVVFTPTPGYLRGWSLTEEPHASGEPIRIKSHHEHRIYDFQVAPDGESWRLARLLREDGSTAATYEYGPEGRLERIHSGTPSTGTYLQFVYSESKRLKTVTPYVDDVAVAERARRLLYDGDRVKGIQNAGCSSCGSWNRYFYYDENGRIVRITNREEVDLERFGYDARGRLIRHDRRNDQNTMVTVKTVDYGDLGQGSTGTVTIHEPVSETQERILVEHYDVDGRLTGTDRYPALFPRNSQPCGDTLSTTTHYSLDWNPLTGVTTKVTEVTNSAGVTSVSMVKTSDHGLPNFPQESTTARGFQSKLPDNWNLDGPARYLWTYTRGEDGGITNSTFAFSEFNEATASFLTTYRVDRRGITELTYDGLGRLETRTDPAVTLLDGGGTVRSRTTYEYDEQGHPIRIGRTKAGDDFVFTGYEHDDFGRVITQMENVDALEPDLRPVTRYEYSVFGERTKVTDPHGTVTETFRDDAGRITDEVIYQKEDNGPILTQRHHDYNANGRLERTRAAVHPGAFVKNAPRAWSDTTYTHDLMGRVLSESSPGPDSAVLTTTFHYDYQGRIIEQVNPDGSVNRTVYDGLGREAARMTEGTGVSPLITKHHYDVHGRLAESISPSGLVMAYEYDEFGRQTAVEKGDVLRTEDDYDDGGQMVRTLVSDLGSGKPLSDTTFEYDELGRRIVVRRRTTADSDSDNDSVKLTVFNVEGRTAATIEKADGNNDLTAYEPGDRRTQTIYDVLGRAVKTVDPAGTDTDTDYDVGGAALSRTIDRSGLSLTEWYTHDALGRPKRVTDADGHYAVYEYDSRGNIIGHKSFDNTDVPLAQTRIDYDLAGRRTRTARMLDPASMASPDPATDAITEQHHHSAGVAGAGRPAKTIEHDRVHPRTTLIDYDVLGRPVRVSSTVNPQVNFEETEYRSDTGLIAARVWSDPLGTRRVEVEHDTAGRRSLVRIIGNDGSPDLETRYAYDGLGRPTRLIAADGSETHIRYDLLGREIERIEDATRLARKTLREYDRLGNLSALTASDGAADYATRYSYDAAGQLTLIRYPDHGLDGQSGEVALEYDAAGRLSRRTDQRGIVTQWEYNGRSMPTRKLASAMKIDDRYAYDGLGRLTAHQRDGSHQVKRHYNGLGQLTKEQQTVGGVPKTITFAYNPLGERTAVNYPTDTATKLTYDYDALGQNTCIRRNDEPLVEYEHRGGLMTHRRLRTGRDKAIDTNFAYDHHRRVSAIANTTQGINLISYTFERDSRGLPTATRQTGNQTPTWNMEYRYDTLQRLTRADYSGAVTGSECFAYDLLGNRQHYCPRTCDQQTPTNGVFYEHNVVNEYTKIAAKGVAAAIRHDPAGNLVIDERGYGYSYDADNNLTRVYGDANLNGTYDAGENIHAEYRYDAIGRRVQATIGERTLRYYYDGDNVLAEYEADNDASHRWYVHGTTYIDERAVMYTNAPSVGGNETDDFYFLLGPQYNVAGLVGNRGQLVEVAQYDAYGTPTVYRLFGDTDFDGGVDQADLGHVVLRKTGSAIAEALSAIPRGDTFTPHPPGVLNSYYFTGRRLDLLDSSSLPLQYSRARYYDSAHGRFLQRDPTHYLDGMNLYNYGHGNPVNHTDPHGLKASNEAPTVWPSLGTVEEIKSLHGCSCIFTINVDAYGLAYTGSAQQFLQSLLDANLTREDLGVGHSWVRLEANGEAVQGGHTGMRGNEEENPEITHKLFSNSAYGVIWLSILPIWAPSPMPHLKEYADPMNPAAWLHYTYQDGRWAEGSGTHKITTHECSWCLTEQQAQAIGDEISRLRESGGAALRAFGLTTNQCTHTAAGIADKGGISLDPYTTLVFPRYLHLGLLSFPRFDFGLKIRAWTTRPELANLRFAVPDKMADQIMAWQGPAEYHKICRP